MRVTLRKSFRSSPQIGPASFELRECLRVPHFGLGGIAGLETYFLGPHGYLAVLDTADGA